MNLWKIGSQGKLVLMKPNNSTVFFIETWLFNSYLFLTQTWVWKDMLVLCMYIVCKWEEKKICELLSYRSYNWHQGQYCMLTCWVWNSFCNSFEVMLNFALAFFCFVFIVNDVDTFNLLILFTDYKHPIFSWKV